MRTPRRSRSVSANPATDADVWLDHVPRTGHRRYFSDPALWTTAGVERDTLALAAGTSTAGSLIGWLQTITGGASFAP